MITLVLACAVEEAPTSCSLDEPVGVEVRVAGAAPWDPYLATVTDDPEAWTATPVVAGADGLLTLPPLEIADIVPATVGLRRPDPERPTGEYVTVGGWATPIGDQLQPSRADDACPELRGPTWTSQGALTVVEPFGRAATFDPTTLVQSHHLISPGFAFVGASSALGALVGSVGPLHLEITDVADGVATFRLVAQVYGRTDECVVLRDHASLSATGELTWARDRIDAETDPAPLTLHSPSIRLGFLGDRAAGGEVMAIADVRATVGTDLDLCDLSGSFGAPCQPCPDDRDATCLAVSGFGRNLDFTCESDGLCAGSALALVLHLAWRRRRPAEGARAPSPLKTP